MRFIILATLSLSLCALFGCAVVGPSSISNGRASYNEALNRTEDEQMLLSIVKGRYGESFSILAVSSVAANLKFRVNAGAEFGIGPDENYAGNIVPLSGGLAYEENPTITYHPVQGVKYLKPFLSPISLELMVLIMRDTINQAMYFTLLVDRINNMRNPDFLEKPFAKTDHRFQRFVKLNTELNKAGVIQWVTDPGKNDSFVILIADYAPDYSDIVREYLRLLELPMPKDASEEIEIPVHSAFKGRGLDGITFSTRSTYNLIEILRASVEIPQDQINTGLARNYPKLGLAGKDIHIHASKDKPMRAAIAVRHNGYWFYIDDSDIHTKMFYTLARTLWSISIAAATDNKAVPVLTIPVSQ